MKLFIFILVTLLFGGCDLFTTRTAQAPTQPRSDYQQAVTPDIMISNFINSLKDKSEVNYASCLSDSSFSQKVFSFSPSSAAMAQYPSLSDNWSKKNEEQYLNNLITKIPQNMPITLTLSNVSESPQGDSLIYTASYFINVPTNDPTFPQNYQGELRFNMIRDSRSIWSIYYWQDTKSTNLPSWSDLKGRTYY